MTILQFSKFDGLSIVNKQNKYRFVVSYLRNGQFRVSESDESYYIKEYHRVIKDLDVSN